MKKNAVEEIKNLSEDAKRLLQHKVRGGLQSVISAIELGEPGEASSCVMDISDELRKMGL